jgi:zinc protease
MPFLQLATAALPAALAIAFPQGAAKKPAAAYVAEATKWEHETSDLKPDPRLRFGGWKNGMRYVWADSPEPRNLLVLRLFVDCGSLFERPEELGVAHFLEHMAFNGSRSFKPGTLIQEFQKQGIRFGSHINAHTGFDETVYKLDLPGADPARLRTALKWFRDVIDGLKLDPKEITAEKGVVDAEDTSSSGRGKDLFTDRLDRLLAGSRYPRRLPIGEQPVRAKFDQKLVKGFWDRWYRPERCTFVLVGDLNGMDPTPLLDEAFADAKGRGKAEEPPGDGRESLAFSTTRYTERNGGGVWLLAGSVRTATPEPDDRRARAAAVELALAGDVLEERLCTMVPRPYVVADVGCGASSHFGDDLLIEGVLRGISVRLSTDLDHWSYALHFAERELRRLLERGISDEEWQAARERMIERCTPNEAPRPRDSEDLVEQLLRAAKWREVPMDRAAELELWRKLAGEADRERGFAAFKAEWQRGKLHIVSLGELDFGDSAKELFDDAWKESQASHLDVKPIVRDDLSPLAPPRETKKPKPTGAETAATTTETPFPCAVADPATPPAPKERTALPKLRAERLDLGNGVTATVKQMDGVGGQFRVEAHLGQGLLGLDAARCDVAKLGILVALDAGVGRAKRAELDTALATAGGAIRCELGGEATVFEGRSTGRGGESGLRRMLEALAAYLTDRADPAPAFERLKKNLGAHVVTTDRPTFGNARLAFDRATRNGDERRLPPTPAAAAITAEEITAWIAVEFTGPVELLVVGELPLETMTKQVLNVLASLPSRGAAPAAPPAARRSAPPFKAGVDELRGALDVDSTHVHLAWSAIDARTSANERLLELAGDVLQGRIRDEIREKLGTTYSPWADAWGDPVFEGSGRFIVEFEVEPSKLAVTREAALATADALGRSGATQAELDRVRTALSSNSVERARDLGFWLTQLHRAKREPELFHQLAELPKWYDAVTLADLNALLRKSLSRANASILEVRVR